MLKKDKVQSISDYVDTDEWAIFMSKLAWEKLKAYVDSVDIEISGQAKSSIDKAKKIITVQDLMIYDQTCTGSTTDLDEGAMAKFMHELMKKKENPRNWNIWWHSHVDMGVFWSSTDENNIQSHDEQKFLISIVTNKKREINARIDIWQTEPTFGLNMVFRQDVEVYVLEEKDTALQAKIKKEVKKKVKTETYQKQSACPFLSAMANIPL